MIHAKRRPWMRLIPALLSVLFVLLHAIPERALVFSDVVPSFIIMTIYYWCLFRPSLLPYIFLFLLGLLQDVLLGLPIGLSALVFLLLRLAVVTLQRLFGKETFWGIWFWFAILSAAAALIHILTLSWLKEAWVLPASALIQWLLTVVCYPLAHGMFTRIYRRLPKDRTVTL